MRWRRPRFTIRTLMIVTVIVAVVLAIVLNTPRARFFGGHHWVLFGPALLVLLHRLILVGLMRREEADEDVRTPPRW